MVAIPRPQSQVVDRSGLPTREWYTFLLELANSQGMTPAQQAQLNQLAEQVEQLEQGGAVSFQLLGVGSVQTYGTPAQGIVQVTLDGDVDAPGATWFYGTGPDGAKGWYALGDAIEVAAGQLTKDVDSTSGVVTLGLADVPDSGVGTLQRTSFDAKGRKTGTAAATTDNLTEGSTNLYFTSARVRGTPLTGLSTASGGAIVATDTVLQAFGKLQNEMSLRLTDAPSDSQTYGRKNATWVTTVGEAPIDGSTYGRKDGAWVVVTGGGGGGGTVTSVDGSGGTTGLTLTGGPITGSGTLTLGGTLGIANGGTGATSASAARTALSAAASGAVTASGLTIATSRLLGRTTAGSGAIEEISVSGGLSLSGGVLALASSGGPYVLKTGDTMSGSLTSTTLLATTGVFAATGGTMNAILATSGTASILFRPNGSGSTSGQCVIDSSGNLTIPATLFSAGANLSGQLFFNGNLNQIRMLNGTYDRLWILSSGGDCGVFDQNASNWGWRYAASGGFYTRGFVQSGGNVFESSSNTVILSGQSGGAVYFRPNGSGSTTGQATIGSTGDLNVAGNVYAGGTWHFGTASEVNLATTSSGGVIQLRPNGVSATAQVQITSAGTINQSGQGSEFNRAAANSTTMTRQPRIFVGGSDPGAAAADGDIWIP